MKKLLILLLIITSAFNTIAQTLPASSGNIQAPTPNTIPIIDIGIQEGELDEAQFVYVLCKTSSINCDCLLGTTVSQPLSMLVKLPNNDDYTEWVRTFGYKYLKYIPVNKSSDEFNELINCMYLNTKSYNGTQH
jgi:hypothetical protein